MSTTAMGITGDIETTENVLTIDSHRLKLVRVRKLEGKELLDASDLLNATLNNKTRGELYQTYFSAKARIQVTNTLCGKQPTQWIVMLHTIDRENRANLELALFTGNQQPNLTPAVIRNSKDLCGTFWYQR